MEFPRISINIEMLEEQSGKKAVFNKKTGKTYAIGYAEYSVLSMLDGTKSLDEIANKSGVFNIFQLKALIAKFEEIGFIYGDDLKVKINIFKIRKRLLDGNSLINPKNIIWRLLYYIIIFSSIPVFLLGLVYAFVNADMINAFFENTLFSPSALIAIPVSILILALHELGHAVVARMNGVSVPEIGAMIYLFMPFAYTNLSCLPFQKSKWRRMIILLGGMLVNLMLCGICLLLTSITSDIYRQLLLWGALVNFSQIFTNTVFFIKLDGYFILEELMDIKHLREDSFAYSRSLIDKIIPFRKNRGQIPMRHNRQYIDDDRIINNGIFLLYSVFALSYTPIILLTLVFRIYMTFFSG